ncbi:cytochrome C oxidase subunit II [Salipaludibacillus sp. HK11]|uniref:cytochrome C oxidase subunit II n=1 Tax=Salipaludibacillus sp. HK11 TaxID=3394320 RepID=UPI0039FBF764
MKNKIIGFMLLALVLVLAACGGNNDVTENESAGNENVAEETENENGEEEEEASSSVVELNASNWDFDQDTYTAEAGEVTINLNNEEGHHGIEIEGTDVVIDGEGSATADLEPGEYRIYCSIPCGEGHDEMEAMLVVE